MNSLSVLQGCDLKIEEQGFTAALNTKTKSKESFWQFKEVIYL